MAGRTKMHDLDRKSHYVGDRRSAVVLMEALAHLHGVPYVASRVFHRILVHPASDVFPSRAKAILKYIPKKHANNQL
jgi:hypothetical protein